MKTIDAIFGRLSSEISVGGDGSSIISSSDFSWSDTLSESLDLSGVVRVDFSDWTVFSGLDASTEGNNNLSVK